MTYRILLLASLLFLGFALTAQKPGKRVKKRATERTEQRANQRIDQKVDEEVDKAFNAIEGLFKKKNKPAAGQPTDEVDEGGLRPNNGEDAYASDEEATAAVMNALGMGGGDWEPYTNPVTFSLTMEMTEVKRNGKTQTMQLQLGATEEQFAYVTAGEGGGERYQMILNTQDGKTTMITTDKKGETQGFRMRMPNLQDKIQAAAADSYDYLTFTKTGQRRTIDGYDCELIIVEDSKHNTTTESWVTQDIDLDAMDVFGSVAGMAGAGGQAAGGGPQGLAAPFEGFPIESTTKDGKATTTVKMRDIRIGADAIDRSLFDTGGVAVREF